MLALSWCVGVAVLEVGAVVRVDLLQLYGVGTILLAAATCTALRRRGHAALGYAVGSTLFLLFLYLALSNPVPQLLPLFPLLTAGRRRRSAATLRGRARAPPPPMSELLRPAPT